MSWPIVDVDRFWCRFDDEVAVCPSCTSARITLLDVFGIPLDSRHRCIRFITGCKDCGLLFSNPLPQAEQLAAFYGDGGEWAVPLVERERRFEARRLRRLARGRGGADTDKPRPLRRRDWLFKAIGGSVPVHSPPPGAKALDFGCGRGKMLDWLQDRGWETYGIEPSMDAAFARHRRLTAVPQDGRFTFVILNHVLEHLLDPLDVLRQITGALRDDGTLCVSVPRVDTLPKHGDLRYCINGRNHPLCFSEVCLRGLLARAGMAVTTRLDAQELDDVFTEGKPLRLRLLAVRASHPPPLPANPLVPGIRALRLYHRSGDHQSGNAFHRPPRWLPVRLRGALMDRALQRWKARA